MKTIILSRIKLVAIAIVVFSVFSCNKKESTLKDLNETIFVRHKKADMPAYIHGNGSEKVFLVILHGGPGGNGLFYRTNGMESEIEKNNAVVYFDQRGSGNSQGQYSKNELNLDVMAEDVLALVQVLKHKFGDDSKIFLMGHSWGGTLAPAVLLKNQADFTGWIDVAGVHDPKGSYDAYRTTFDKTANEQIALSNSVDYWNSLLELTKNVAPNNNAKDLTKLNAAAFKAEEQLEQDNVINKLQFEFGTDITFNNQLTLLWNNIITARILLDKELIYETVSFTDRLSEIKIPSLVLWGKYDMVVPTVFAQEAFDNIGSEDKDIFIFEKSAHTPMVTESDLFADKVIEFINSH